MVSFFAIRLFVASVVDVGHDATRLFLITFELTGVDCLDWIGSYDT